MYKLPTVEQKYNGPCSNIDIQKVVTAWKRKAMKQCFNYFWVTLNGS